MDPTLLLIGLVAAFAILMLWTLRRGQRPPKPSSEQATVSAPDVLPTIEPPLAPPIEPGAHTALEGEPLPAGVPAAPAPPEASEEVHPAQVSEAPLQVAPPAPPQPLPKEPARPAFPAEIVSAMPSRVVFMDVETTGLHSTDRIVSLGLVRLETARLTNWPVSVDVMHLIFDPGKKSHAQAERVHGWHDWTLRHQDNFADHAETVLAMLQSADLLVAHNANFDMRFVSRELDLAGLSMPAKPVECTMQAWRDRGLSPASLSAVCGHIGVARAGDTHGALEDAALAMQAWLALRAPSFRLPTITFPPPSNLREPPQLPDGPLPRRKARKARPST